MKKLYLLLIATSVLATSCALRVSSRESSSEEVPQLRGAKGVNLDYVPEGEIPEDPKNGVNMFTLKVWFYSEDIGAFGCVDNLPVYYYAPTVKECLSKFVNDDYHLVYEDGNLTKFWYGTKHAEEYDMSECIYAINGNINSGITSVDTVHVFGTDEYKESYNDNVKTVDIFTNSDAWGMAVHEVYDAK